MVFAISSPVSALRKLPCHPRMLRVIWVFFGLIQVMIWQKPCNTILVSTARIWQTLPLINYCNLILVRIFIAGNFTIKSPT